MELLVVTGLNNQHKEYLVGKGLGGAMQKIFGVFLIIGLFWGLRPMIVAAQGLESSAGPYQLQKIVILSRHNLRSPLSGRGSILDDITPHQWFKWTSSPGELSLRGAVLETIMGQYFRCYLLNEGLLSKEGPVPLEELRFYANSLQRTIATAQYFANGLLPAENVQIEHRTALGEMDPVFDTNFTVFSETYRTKVMAEIAAKGGQEGLKGIGKHLAEDYKVLERVLDLKASTMGKTGQLTQFRTDDLAIDLAPNDGPRICNSMRTAIAASDALVLQYYEENNAEKAAFGHKLTHHEWEQISEIKDTGIDILCGTSAAGINLAHPLLQEMQSELADKKHKITFLCGHDTNISSVLAALDVTPYDLPCTLEKKTPIGGQIVIEKWLGTDGELYGTVNMVYPSTEQIRAAVPLSLGNPPMCYPLRLRGLKINADGYYRFEDLQQRFKDKIHAYDNLLKD